MAGGIYTSLSGAIANQRQLEVVANNLANVSTPGFKRDGLVFGEVLASQVHRQVEVSGEYTDHSVGPMEETGRSLDLAIPEQGVFFTVQTPKGVRLTRVGKLHVAQDGTLVDEHGYRLVGVEKPYIKVSDPNAQVYVTEDGTVMADGTKVDSLLLQRAANPRMLRKEGHNLFVPTASAQVRRLGEGEGRLLVGYVEGSNVNAVSSMVELITLQRHFELNTKAIQTYEAMDRLATEKVGAPR